MFTRRCRDIPDRGPEFFVYFFFARFFFLFLFSVFRRRVAILFSVSEQQEKSDGGRLFRRAPSSPLCRAGDIGNDFSRQTDGGGGGGKVVEESRFGCNVQRALVNGGRTIDNNNNNNNYMKICVKLGSCWHYIVFIVATIRRAYVRDRPGFREILLRRTDGRTDGPQ